MLISVVSVHAAGNTGVSQKKEADIVLEVRDDSVYTKNILNYSGSSRTINFVDAGNEDDKRRGILLKDHESPQLLLNIDNKFVKAVNDGTTFDVEFDYYVLGPTDFQFGYDSVKRNKTLANEYMGVTGKWETKKIHLNDAYFDNRFSGNDIYFSGLITYNYVISAIRIYMHSNAEPVIVSEINTKELGNIFNDDDEQRCEVVITNREKRAIDLKLTMYAQTMDGNTVWIGESKNITARAKNYNVENFTLDIKHYGRMLLFARVEGDGFMSEYSVPFAHVNSSAKDTKNPIFGWNTGLGWGEAQGYSSKNIIELLSKSGAGLVRFSVQWNEVEMEKGVYTFPEETYGEFLDWAAQNDIGIILMSEGSVEYYDDNARGKDYIPIGKEAVKGFGNYVRFLIQEVKRRGVNIVAYEMFNEVDLSKFNLNNATGADMAKLVDEERRIVNELDPGKIIYPLALSGAVSDYGHKIYSDLIENSEEENNGVDLHMYSWEIKPEIGVREGLKWYIDKYKELKGGDLKIIASELGYHLFPTSFMSRTEEERAKENMRNYITLVADGNVEYLCWYALIHNGNEHLLREQQFGAVLSGASRINYILHYAAMETYVGFANLNKILCNAHCEKVISEGVSNVYAYIFRRPEDNKLVMPVWTTYSEQGFEFTCSADSLEAVDMYGNQKTIYPENGKYSITLTDAVTYLTGDIADISVLSYPVALPQRDFTGAGGDEIKIPLELIDENLNGKLTAKLTCQNEKIRISNAEISVGGRDALSFILPDEGINKTSLFLTVYNEKEQMVFAAELNASGTEKYSISMDTVPTDDVNKWGIEYTIENKSAKKTISGEIKIDPLSYFGRLFGDTEIKNIPAGKTAKITVEPKTISEFGSFPVELDININGEKTNIQSNKQFSVATYTSKPPVIDGDITDEEWGNCTAMVCESPEQVKFGEGFVWSGVDDLSTKTMMQYDEENLYLAVETRDDIITLNPARNGDIWLYDSIQFGTSFEWEPGKGQDVEKFTEISLGDTEKGPYVYCGRVESEGVSPGSVEKYEFKLKRNGIRTYYEIAIPWSQLTGKKIDWENTESFRFSMLVNDNDGKGRKGWIEYGSGIGATKDISQFAVIKFSK